ncbi:hypothetical protein C922_03302 [Plasmodium inui San Antonio 1]|uniref:Uncharacterized protein n=1 Tax=Plasmodium inui San Antonio 1 TaxID=1237626 RepID=W7AM27_9APIC|nr:hypothetical protein C922_03302 [Plasmodium inui San Antonio 1]EUD66386.1 hypothetical protein C922_03302 [Plasmodium inui San Antonio 1]
MSLIWDGDLRDPTEEKGQCEITNDKKYCYAYPDKGKDSCDRTAAGYGAWMTTLMKGRDQYTELVEGYEKGITTTKGGKNTLEWTDILDGVLTESIRSAYNEKPTENEDDDYLKLPTRRMWKGLMGADNKLPCQNSGNCQKMLYFIGCLLYILLEKDARIIRIKSNSFRRCKQLMEKVLSHPPPRKLTTDRGIYWKREGRNLCQASQSYSDCKLEFLSFLLGISTTLRQLCPKCEQVDLRTLLTKYLNCGKDQGIYCPRKPHGGNIRCTVQKNGPGEELAEIFPHQEKIVEENSREPAREAHLQTKGDGAIEENEELAITEKVADLPEDSQAKKREEIKEPNSETEQAGGDNKTDVTDEPAKPGTEKGPDSEEEVGIQRTATGTSQGTLETPSGEAGGSSIVNARTARIVKQEKGHQPESEVVQEENNARVSTRAPGPLGPEGPRVGKHISISIGLLLMVFCVGYGGYRIYRRNITVNKKRSNQKSSYVVGGKNIGNRETPNGSTVAQEQQQEGQGEDAGTKCPLSDLRGKTRNEDRKRFSLRRGVYGSPPLSHLPNAPEETRQSNSIQTLRTRGKDEDEEWDGRIQKNVLQASGVTITQV